MKTKLLWINALACNGNSHSFLNYEYLEQFFNNFEFIYHPIIDSNYSLKDISNKYIQCDILLIEGSISKNFKKADKSIEDIIEMYAPNVKKIITVGTCSSYGGIFKDSSYFNTTGLLFLEKKSSNKFQKYKNKTICISGCPIHPEVLVNTLYSVKNKINLSLDKFLRLKEYFAYSVHNGCTRNEYFEYKIDNHNYGKLEGCMFYNHGCQGPYTSGSCNKILSNGVNSKTRAGSQCNGCTEPSFPKSNLFFTKKNMGIPENLPFDVNKRAYLTLAGISKAFKIPRLEKGLFDD